MNFLKNLFKRKERSQAADNMEVIRSRLARNQQTVYEAVVAIAMPCRGRDVSDFLGWDSASVTNRLAELARKGQVKVAYRKRGLDGIWRNYYVATLPKVNEHPGEL